MLGNCFYFGSDNLGADALRNLEGEVLENLSATYGKIVVPEVSAFEARRVIDCPRRVYRGTSLIFLTKSP